MAHIFYYSGPLLYHTELNKDDLNSLKKELFNLKIMKKSGQLTDTSQFKKVKKQIASLLTRERLEKNA